jgi:P-type Ca2+ transporter type 2C
MSVTISHRLPGRLRLVIEGLQNQAVLAYRIESGLQMRRGIVSVQCKASTGRALVHYQEQLVSAKEIVRLIQTVLANRSPVAMHAAVAATSETERMTAANDDRTESPHQQPFSAHVQHAAVNAAAVVAQPTSNPYAIPALASTALLGGFAVKRLLVGQSMLAAAPGPFYLAAGASIIAGYPFLRRPIEQKLSENRRNPDLWLGAAALGLAVLRENLVALSAITLVNLAMYRRHEVLRSEEATLLSPETQLHARRMSRVGLWLAPLAWLLSGNPLSALGVLLAANPRPASLAHKYAWAKAERKAHDEGMPMPRTGNLEHLAAANTIVFTSAAAMVQDTHELAFHTLEEDLTRDKVASLSASLLQKVEDHPLHRPLMREVSGEHPIPMRTAFDVKAQQDGVHGTINGNDMWLGSKAFLKEAGIVLTPALYQERRLRREGYKPYLLAQNGQILALIGCKQQLASPWRNRVETWQAQGYEVRCLQMEECVPCELEMMTPHEIGAQMDAGRPLIMIGDHQLEQSGLDASSPLLVTVAPEDVSRLDEVMAFGQQTRETLHRDLRAVKIWNVVGIGLAFAAPLTAPLINLLGDAMGVFLITRHDMNKLSAPWRLGQAQAAAASATTATIAPTAASSATHNHLHAAESRPPSAPWHAFDSTTLLEKLRSRRQGLSADEVLILRRSHRWNELDAPAPPNPLRIFIGQFKEFSTLILLGATGLSLLMGERFNALCMGGIIVVNAIIGTLQEVRSAGVLQALQHEEASQVRVIRHETEQLVRPRELVPGDAARSR